MRPRILTLPIAALIITALCVYKVTRTEPGQSTVPGTDRPPTKRPAPGFELYDHHKPNRLVRLRAYLGRHRLLVVFFDGEKGADRSSILLHLREQFDKLESAGIKILAISEALPQENRKIIARSGPFPFPLLSDPGLKVHRTWGRWDEATGRPLQGVFLIDRAGLVTWANDAPRPLKDPQETIQRLIHED